jgi:hypothetical protein
LAADWPKAQHENGQGGNRKERKGHKTVDTI